MEELLYEPDWRMVYAFCSLFSGVLCRGKETRMGRPDNALRRRPLVSAVLVATALATLAAAGSDRRVVDAARERDWATVAGLIKQRADVNVPHADGATALQWAAHWDNLEAVAML